MENDLATLLITEEEDDVIQLMGPLIGRTSLYEFCFVGCFVTTSVIHFPDMNNTLANLWHPLGGIQITDLREKWFLFWFFNCVDFDRVVRGAHWTFNNHLLVFHCLRPSKDPLLVPLIYSYFWVQIHDLPPGLFSEAVARALGNFVGLFEEYDAKEDINSVVPFLQMRVKVDIQAPLQHRKNIQLSPGDSIYVQFWHDKLTLFCFLCGRLGHGDNFYPIHLERKSLQMIWDGIFLLEWLAGLPTTSSACFLGGLHLVLGMNLEGVVSRATENVLGVYGFVSMIYDLKYALLVGIGGKKRLRSGRSSRLVSEGSNSLKAGDERSLTCQLNISAAAKE
ncbi:hypothetical protein Goarm_011142 [Gossypium armourianum]|uniref:DUF4283 domain-containing protein n=1 Tax=Gossypium armourianum TaxID=34283 RepID=A0A7J9IYM2_9ROSI|nr:hypothetical protein [Gossypium armourianum]